MTVIAQDFFGGLWVKDEGTCHEITDKESSPTCQNISAPLMTYHSPPQKNYICFGLVFWLKHCLGAGVALVHNHSVQGFPTVKNSCKD